MITQYLSTAANTKLPTLAINTDIESVKEPHCASLSPKHLDKFHEQYKQKYKLLEQSEANFNEIDEIKTYLVTNMIKCVKYNSNFDASSQKHQSYEAII